MNSKNKRPWGYFEVLSDAPDHAVKRIVVAPGKRLSLQRHKLHAEHWFVVQGEGKITVDGLEYPARAGLAVDIPAKSTHRMENTSAGDFVVIEIQTGDYFGEDDIERLEDDYGRI